MMMLLLLNVYGGYKTEVYRRRYNYKCVFDVPAARSIPILNQVKKKKLIKKQKGAVKTILEGESME